MTTTEKTFHEIKTMAEAMQHTISSAQARTMRHNTPENHTAATFMCAISWMLVNLMQASGDGRIHERLLEMADEQAQIWLALAEAQQAAH